MKKIIKCILILISIILLKLVIFFSINEIIINNYNHDIYNNKLINVLYIFNLNESYIPYYNNGNIEYKINNYNKAISLYNKALIKNPTKKRVCDIRVNLSLAMIKNINSKNKNIVLNELNQAKENLYNNGCANRYDNNGSSTEAERLKEEISNLENNVNNNSSDNSSNNDNKENNNEKISDDDMSSIEEELKKNEKEANKARQGEMSDSQYVGNYEYYNGKKW